MPVSTLNYRYDLYYFRTASWRNPIEGPYHRPRRLLEAVRWALVFVIALALVGAQL